MSFDKSFTFTQHALHTHKVSQIQVSHDLYRVNLSHHSFANLSRSTFLDPLDLMVHKLTGIF